MVVQDTDVPIVPHPSAFDMRLFSSGLVLTRSQLINGSLQSPVNTQTSVKPVTSCIKCVSGFLCSLKHKSRNPPHLLFTPDADESPQTASWTLKAQYSRQGTLFLIFPAAWLNCQTVGPGVTSWVTAADSPVLCCQDDTDNSKWCCLL